MTSKRSEPFELHGLVFQIDDDVPDGQFVFVDAEDGEVLAVATVTDDGLEKQFAHRWSGWPGAWCLDCGMEDPREICIATGCEETDDETGECPEHRVGWCPEPMSRRHDPYYRKE